MIFRDYRSTDYNELISFWEELELSSPERGDTQEIIEQTLSLGGKLILLYQPTEKIIIGSSWITCDGRRCYLHHFGIRKSFQNRGLGANLLHESFKFIKEKGLPVKLEVHMNNLAAKRLYEKAGFFAFKNYTIYMIRNLENI